MRKALVAVVLALGLGGMCMATDPAITGETSIAEYKLVRFKVTGQPDKTGYLWRVRPLTPGVTADMIDYAQGGHKDTDTLEFIAPPGQYNIELTLVAPDGKGGFTLSSVEKPMEIFRRTPIIPNPNPVPGPQPGPTPVPAPTVVADPVLTERFKEALAKDTAAMFPGGGSKGSSSALADVFLTAADMLSGDDESQWPKTIAELYTRLSNASNAKKVPKLPYMAAIRDVAGTAIGAFPDTRAIDPAFRADLASRFRKVGLSLKKASE